MKHHEHRWWWVATLCCWWSWLCATLKRPLPPLIHEWVREGIIPPWWMGFVTYSYRRKRLLFVIYPLHYLVMLWWWVQDKWARHTKHASWIEEELRRRLRGGLYGREKYRLCFDDLALMEMAISSARDELQKLIDCLIPLRVINTLPASCSVTLQKLTLKRLQTIMKDGSEQDELAFVVSNEALKQLQRLKDLDARTATIIHGTKQNDP